MRRITCKPRPNWQKTVEGLGFSFHTIEGETYWQEGAYYGFTPSEVALLETAAHDLWQRCLEAVEHVITRKRFAELGILERAADYITASWHDRDPSLYGRFDFSFDGQGPPKLLEFNADTPTSLLEAAVVQWQWLSEVFEDDTDQFNSIHEALVKRWKHILPGKRVHFASCRVANEDCQTTEYLRDTCIQAGHKTVHLDVSEIGWDGLSFTDLTEGSIDVLFKLYPWEWLFAEEFASYLPLAPTLWVEPPWKLILASKGILAILWELFPGHANLLPAHLKRWPVQGSYVQKPLFSREGANVSIHTPEGVAAKSMGPYGQEGFVYQQYAALPKFDDFSAVTGVWLVGDKACGLGMREDQSPITGNNSRFVPHCILES